ncbi:MAG: excinuclease ABC subunit UvrB [Planctomycetota bacterium]
MMSTGRDRRAQKRRAPFELVADYQLAGDQPAAVERLCTGLASGRNVQTLMGVTGSGKTFMMAHLIARHGRPALLISHNKTLAAQLYCELKAFFPRNAVEYFVSYYDYYQPEAYIPQRDIYIEKDAAINDDIDRLRLSATSSLMSREDVIIVASVSCIYGLGSPEEYQQSMLTIERDGELDRDTLLARLVELHYVRNDIDPARGSFRARGDTVEIFPAYQETGFRLEFFGDTVEQIEEFQPVSGTRLQRYDVLTLYPAKHFVINDVSRDRAMNSIQVELRERLAVLERDGNSLAAHRLGTRTRYDLELLREIGYCPGIENYSRHFTGLQPGERPYNLFDYFPRDFLCLVDESHVTIPQLGAMYEGDRSRKQTLVDHGFRLPSALDNRPMKFTEWEEVVHNLLFISATPGPYELRRSAHDMVEAINRPTGLLDPVVEIHPARGQVQHLLGEIRTTVARGDRVLVTTLTKRMAEDLSEYLLDTQIKARYLHSDIKTLERVQILQELRSGKYDVLVGVNLLREGLDLPEVALVAVMDADKEGYLRSATSLIQTIGRAARNERARVILYADQMTGSIERAVSETSRRRTIQKLYNEAHGITPLSISKPLGQTVDDYLRVKQVEREVVREPESDYERNESVHALESEMLAAAKELDFERAAALRDRIKELRRESPRGDHSGPT